MGAPVASRYGAPRIEHASNGTEPCRFVRRAAASTAAMRPRRPHPPTRSTSGSRTSGVGMRPCAWSTPLNTDGFGSAKQACTTGSSASACARPSSTLPASPHSIIATKRSVHTCAAAQIAPAPPISTVGKRNGSSPPSTEKSRGAPARISSVSASSAPTACFTPDDVGVPRELEHPRRPEVAAGADGDVVDDDRHRARRGDRLEVRDDAGFRRAHVVRHDDERGDERRRARERLDRGDRLGGAVGARADDQLRAALGADAGAAVDHRALLGGVERRRLAGGAERDDPGAAGVEVLVAQALDRVEGDRAVGRERGDERDVDALEQSTALRPVTGARVPRRPARGPGRKTSSSIGSVSRPVNVFCCDGW